MYRFLSTHEGSNLCICCAYASLCGTHKGTKSMWGTRCDAHASDKGHKEHKGDMTSMQMTQVPLHSTCAIV